MARGMIVAAVAAAVVVFAAPVAAQVGTPANPPTQPADSGSVSQAEVQALLVEAQQIQQRLIDVQRQALSDPQISEQREALGERVQAAMVEVDPELEQSLERIQELEPEMAAAQQAGDTARLGELVAEARRMEARLARAQQAALEDPELKETVLAFNARVEERMLAIEPETPRLLERLQELQERLRGMSDS